MNDIAEQIQDMIDLRTSAPPTDPPGTDAPPTDAPPTDAPGTEAPSTDAPATDAQSTDAPTTDAPVEDPFEGLKSENAELRKTIEEMSGKSKSQATSAPGTFAPTTDVPEVDYLGDAGVDDIIADKESFNKFLKGFATNLTGQVEKQTTEKLLRSVPDIVKTNVIIQHKLKTMADDFYSDNEDLLPFRRAVASVSEEIMSENPDWELEKVFEETGKEARKRLQLQEKVAKKQPDKKRRKFPKTPGGRRTTPRSKPDTDPMLSEIDEMNKTL